MDAIFASLKVAVATASQTAREEVLNNLMNLVISLEKPIDTFNRIASAQLPIAIVKSAIDAGYIRALAESKESLSAEQVASQVGAAPLLTLQGVVTETGKDQFAANDTTRAFAEPSFQGGINHYFETVATSSQAIPAFLKENKYQDVVENTKTAFNKAHNTPLPGFVWFQHNPENLGYFMQFMPIQRHGLADWLSNFPVKSEIGNWKAEAAGNSKSAVLVDVGGGFGHQAIGFSQKYPNLGRVVVQDMAPVLEHAPVPPNVEKQPINFFEEQPEKGAKFYYLRNILHDYPDSKALVILKHIIAALGPDSEILIDEMCLPEKGVPLLSTTMDLMMGFCLASCERTLEQWQKLLDAAGLKIKSMHQYTHTLADTVIVAVPK